MRWFWIDRYTEFESGKRATAIKNVTLAEEHLHDHFPGSPLMPNPLVVEGMAQTGGLLVAEHSDFEERVVLAKLAKEKKLKPSQYEGGGFSVSNLGMYGIKNFTSIINPPQSCIIAVGAGEERPVVINGKIEIATVMTVTMSADHRVVDGGTGAKFLQTLKQFIEEPASMLL